MRTLILAFIALIIALANAHAEPQRIEDPETESPCDNAGNSGKPHCDTDSESIKVPTPLPNEQDAVIVPPDIPAEGLPHQDKNSPSDNGAGNPQTY